jgi:hypothetical protein
MRAVSLLQTPLTDPAALYSLNLPVALRPNENDLERFEIAVSHTHAGTFRNNPWIMNLTLTRDKETKRQREWTLIPGFFVHMNTRAHFLKQSHKLSHTQTHKKNVCLCVCSRAPCVLCYCLKGEQPPSASVYGQGTLTRHPRADSGNIKASGCAALWAHQRMSACR